MGVRTKKYLYEFGPFVLDPAKRLLLREGEPVALTPKAVETLIALVETGGRVIEKEELMKRIWPDTYVDEPNLAVNISTLRKALGERPDGGQYIETVPKRGYRFSTPVIKSSEPGAQSIAEENERAAPVEGHKPAGIADDEAVARASKAQSSVGRAASLTGKIKGHGLAGTVVLTALVVVAGAIAYFAHSGGGDATRGSAQVTRLAVLPLKNEGAEPDADSLGYTLADAIITKLQFVGSLIVRPSAYVEKYKDQQIDPEKVAEELNVDTLLTGRYIRDGENLRITVQLVDVRSKARVWGETINRKYENLLAVQDYVAQQVIKGLRLNLTAAETERVKHDVTVDPDAYQHYFRARHIISTNKHQKAIELLEKSVELDQNFALAWAFLAKSYHIRASQYSGGRNDYFRAEAAYEQALKLDAEHPHILTLFANFFTETGRVEQAVSMLRKVMEANPNHAYARWELSYAYRYAGALNESIEEGERALQLDPKLKAHLFNSYLYSGQYDEFINGLPPREMGYIIFYRGLGYYYVKDWDRAKAAFDRAYEFDSKTIITRIGKALSLAISNLNGKGLEVLRAAESEVEKSRASDGEITYKLAQAYAVLGDRASALGALGRSIEQGFFCYPYFISDPLLENIRGEALYAPLMEKARGRHEEFRRNFF